MMVNVAPRPAPSLAAVIVPPCNSTRCFTSDSPSPTPPYLLPLDESACRKRSKKDGRNSGSTPLPVSLTAIRI